MRVVCVENEDYEISLSIGKSYSLLGIEDGWYRVIDETGEDYLYPPIMFVNDPETDTEHDF